MEVTHPKKQHVVFVQRFNYDQPFRSFIKVCDGSVVGSGLGQCPQFYQCLCPESLIAPTFSPTKTNCEHTGKIIFLDLILNPIPLLLGSEESMLDKEAFGCSKET